jgi:hypothetical protein
MIGRFKGRTRGGMLVGAVLGAAASVACGASADIGFARKGPFEICLDGAYDAWLKAQAELLVNDALLNTGHRSLHVRVAVSV